MIVLWKTSFHHTYATLEKITMLTTRFWKLTENWKEQLDNSEKVGAIFMDLSKVYDMINHSLLLAKPKAYGFSNQALSLLQEISEKHN